MEEFESLSPSEASALNDQLTDEIQTIQMQLGDRNKLNDDGSRMSAIDYYGWRHKAQAALTYKLARKRALKALLRRTPAVGVIETSGGAALWRKMQSEVKAGNDV